MLKTTRFTLRITRFFLLILKKINQIVFIFQLSSEIFEEDKMGSMLYFASWFTLASSLTKMSQQSGHPNLWVPLTSGNIMGMS